MKLEYLWINLSSYSDFKYYCTSSFKCNLTTVPLFSSTELSYSTLKVLEAEEIHLYWLSSLCFEITSTFEATKNEE